MRIKLFIILILAISAVIIVGYISYYGLKSLMVTIEQNLEPDSREADLESLLFQIAEAESNLRIYAITEESRYLQPYYVNVEKADSLLQVLQKKSKSEQVIFSHLDTIHQTLIKKVDIQNRLIRLNKEKAKIDVYEEIIQQFQYLEKRNAMIDSLRLAVERAEQTIENEIREREIQDLESSTGLQTDAEEKKGFFRRLFKSGKKSEQEPAVRPSINDNNPEELAGLMATKDTLTWIIDTLRSDDIALEMERTLDEIRIRQENINRELARIELGLTKRDKAFGYQIQLQAARIHKIFTDLDTAQAQEASNFFHSITNRITMTGSIFAMLFIILVFIVMNDINVNQRYRKALEESKNKAEELAQAKEDFLSNMSHEIRTPLNAIIGFSEQMAGTDLNNQSREQLKIIQSASGHLLSIINDILDYAKIEAGKIQLENISFSIEKQTRIVYDTLQKSAKDKQLEFSLDFDQSVIGRFAMGDPVRYRQILFNLIGNAIKFTDQGFVKIHTQLEHDDLIIKVSDSGPGIDSAFLDIIFNKFDQVPASGLNKKGGTGLGLAIVKKLVDMHNGEINVTSELSVGTEFMVRLPYFPPSDVTPDTAEYDGEVESDLSENLRVLIVDDEEFNRKLIETILDKYGISHQSVSSGNEALTLFEKAEFDLVLMDLRMDDLDGFETTKMLREKYKTDIPIIAVTATATGDIREKCRNTGMNDVLIKPISEHDLLKVLKLTPQLKRGSLSDLKIDVNWQEENNETGESVVDLNALLLLFQNDKKLTLYMTRLFHTGLLSAIACLQTDMGNMDYETIRQNVHKIIPSSRHMGFTCFAGRLKDLEVNLMNGADRSDLDEKINIVLSDAKMIIAQLDKFIEELSTDKI